VIVARRQGSLLVHAKREELAAALADELAFVTPLIGVPRSDPPRPYVRARRRGPKGKLAQVVLLKNVQLILDRFGIRPREWAAGGGRGRSELSDWCRGLLAEAGLPRLPFSERQRRYAVGPRGQFSRNTID